MEGYGPSSIYIVSFRVLKNKKKEIIYKTKYYNFDFALALFNFFVYNHNLYKKTNKLYQEIGKFETLVDNNLFTDHSPGISVIAQGLNFA